MERTKGWMTSCSSRWTNIPRNVQAKEKVTHQLNKEKEGKKESKEKN